MASEDYLPMYAMLLLTTVPECDATMCLCQRAPGYGVVPGQVDDLAGLVLKIVADVCMQLERGAGRVGASGAHEKFTYAPRRSRGSVREDTI